MLFRSWMGYISKMLGVFAFFPPLLQLEDHIRKEWKEKRLLPQHAEIFRGGTNCSTNEEENGAERNISECR